MLSTRYIKYVIQKAIVNTRYTIQIWQKNRDVRQAFAASNPMLQNLQILAYPTLSENARTLSLWAALIALSGIFVYQVHNISRHTEIQASLTRALTPPPQHAVSLPAAAKAPSSGILTDIQYIIIASKKHKALKVLEYNGGAWSHVIQYPMGYGEKDGDKQKQGDKKTPEGHYWILDILYGPDVGSLYGALVFPLSYPNKKDRDEGRSGNGIWIHGVEFGKNIKFTRGCLELANSHILQLTKYALPGTPVIILPQEADWPDMSTFDHSWIDNEYPQIYTRIKYKTKDDPEVAAILKKAEAFVSREKPLFTEPKLEEQERVSLLASLEKWRYSWSSKDIDAYSSIFHTNFKGRNGLDRSSFLNRKGTIFQANDSFQISLNDIKIKMQNDSSAIVSFIQDYTAYQGQEAARKSISEKSLWMKKNGSEWAIIKE